MIKHTNSRDCSFSFLKTQKWHSIVDTFDATIKKSNWDQIAVFCTILELLKLNFLSPLYIHRKKYLTFLISTFSNIVNNLTHK